MGCNCSQRKNITMAPQPSSSSVICTNTREEIEDLAVKINCRRELHPSARINSVFNILLEILQTEEYCKYDLGIVHQLIYEFPNVC